MVKLFKTLQGSKKSKARLGEIRTGHGVIKTPAFVPVATKGTLKALSPNFIKDIGIQVAFVNTYHLVTHPGCTVIEKAGGIHKFANLNIPLVSDSGGFQVFSLAKEKIKHFQADVRGDEEPLLVKISDDGVKFRSTYDGKLIEFTPEKSIEYQRKIGADLLMAFDECIPYGSTYDYSKRATERTHGWLLRCVGQVQSAKFKVQNENLKLKINNSLKTENCKLKINQYLYGVIHGGTYEDLRKKSAEFVVSQPVDGVAIGGVAVGESKKEMRDQVKWIADYLPKDRPVHLLGVGQFDDIIDLVKYGVDTFDCVEPTRLGRMGRIYKISNFKFQISNSEVDILKTIYKNNLEPVDKNCRCYVCQNFTKAYLHHLFKQKEILGYTLATYHNLWVMERFFDKIRILIANNQI